MMHRSRRLLFPGKGSPKTLHVKSWRRAAVAELDRTEPVSSVPGIGSELARFEDKSSRAKRILILMSDTGGGHRTSAEALQSAFAERFGERFRVDIIDLWIEYAPWPLNRMAKSYRFLADDTPWLWQFLYQKSAERPEVINPLMEAISKLAGKPVLEVITHYDPDLMICVHPLLHQVPLKLMERLGRKIPFVTVITDLTTYHPAWLNKAVDLCFVPTQEAYDFALRYGMRPEQLRLCGLPIRPIFAHDPPPKEVLRPQLGLRPDVPLVLITGGGEGMGPVAEIARAVAARLAADSADRGNLAGQLGVICGRNRKLQEELEDHDWPIPTVVRGFVDNMPAWMAASDCIITKAGPSTIAEALALGLPILLSGYVKGQEEGNVPYVVDHGVGVYCEDPQEIAAIISRWLGPERATLANMARKAKEMGRPRAVFEIVEEIAKLID
jgi:1,2-diacylglycerol 3-beta-galactosyltransferase